MKKTGIFIFTLIIAALLMTLPFVSVGALTTYTDGDYVYAETSDMDFAALYGFSDRVTEKKDVIVSDIALGRYVMTIYEYAFYNSNLVKELDFTKSRHLYYIDSRAFSKSTVSGTIIFPSTLRNIGFAAFQDCKNITAVTGGNGLTEIPVQCFYGCNSLQSVKLSQNITKIGNLAFADCPMLSYIYIPDSVNEISSSAFTNSFNTVIYCYSNSQAHNYAIEKNIQYVLLDAQPEPTTKEPTTEEPSTAPATPDEPTVEPTEETTTESTEEPSTAEPVTIEPTGELSTTETATIVPATPDQPVYALGDVNCDGIVDVLDAIEIQKAAVDKVFLTEAQNAAGDVNHDGYVDVLDATLILKQIVGKYTIE